MIAKLAIRNIRRSAKDYAIYFITLVCGVAVFYAFNSIGTQQVLADVTANNSSFVDLVKQFISMFSVVVAAVLGFLVLYANRFLIRRRKQEMGTYLLLGMRPSQVAGIVLLETIIVGVFSFVVGTLIGIILSQGMSFVTAALFDTVLDEYRFEFSAQALGFTAVCYSLIFVVVALFNTMQVSRCKLINLLSARGSNEKIVMRSLPACILVFAVAVVCIAGAYYLLNRNGLTEFNSDFAWSTALMLIGTLLLFWSVAGFVVAVVQRMRGVYLRGLTMFSMRQVASRINTAFVSLWAVCVLLFFGITVFTSGMGLGQMYVQGLETASPYDASIIANVYIDNPEYNESVASACEDPEVAQQVQASALRCQQRYASANGDIAAFFADRSSGWNELVANSAQLDIMLADQLTTGEVIKAAGHADLLNSSAFSGLSSGGHMLVVSESQMNQLLRFAGKQPVNLGPSGYIVNNNVDAFQAVADDLVKNDVTLTVAGFDLSPAGPCVSVASMDMSLPIDMLNLVVPDAVMDALRAPGQMPYASYLNIAYADGVTDGDRKLQEVMAQALPSDSEQAMEFYAGNEDSDLDWAHSAWPATMRMTKDEMHSTASSVRVLCTYLAIYIGFVLLIAVAAVLAIQQLSETSDSEGRYRVLAQLGCDRRQIMGSLRTQVLVYFLAPLLVATAHSVCAVSVISSSLLSVWGMSITGAVIATACLLLVVYGGYMLVTYMTARNVIKSSLGHELLG